MRLLLERAACALVEGLHVVAVERGRRAQHLDRREGAAQLRVDGGGERAGDFHAGALDLRHLLAVEDVQADPRKERERQHAGGGEEEEPIAERNGAHEGAEVCHGMPARA